MRIACAHAPVCSPRAKMTASKYSVLLLCVLSGVCCVIGDLDLSEDSACVTKGLNGTCVNVFKCNSAALTYLYREAGFKHLPEMHDICSHNSTEPVVCCTDCDTGTTKFRQSAVGPLGLLVDKEGPVAWAKCLDYFKSLPYPCHGVGNVKVGQNWSEKKQCHEHNFFVLLAAGGRDAQRWEFPHMALIGYGEDAATAQWLCAGSVISEKFILTAAHCTSTHALGSIKFAALGLLKRTDPKENWKIYNIKRIIIHPEYQAPTKYHDIALLETETEIVFGKDLLPACLDVGDVGFHPEPYAEASGWGRLGHRQSLADTLQVVELHEFNETDCANIYQPHRHLKQGYDHEKQMCYGSFTRIVDTCEGDSGGPLQTNMFKCLYTVVGVTSYGKDCGTLGSAGMYTRVSYYVPWIESVVWAGKTNEFVQPIHETNS